jgi:hypothetical protein
MLFSPFARDEVPACMHSSMRTRVCSGMRTLDIQLDVRNGKLFEPLRQVCARLPVEYKIV